MLSLVLMMLPVIALAAANEPKIGPPAGGSPYPAAVETRLRSALRAKGTDYEPRTRHLNDDETPKYTNRLILENSPYLLQHAHNPVDWYPWGDEAFERARREKKPVFLSVGYSTCHWCHVMEEESFEDEEIAAYLNQNYIAIKVDRERRPDVDGVYMTAVRLMTNRGGWPMSVWLTADREPFYGGTYFPPRDGDRGSRTGFLTLLKRLRQAYEEDPDRVAATTAELRDKIGESMAVTPGNALPDDSVPRRAFASEKRAFDEKLGGFGQAPKFPRSVRLEALLRYYRRTKDAEALRMVRRTLDAMAAGGMYDQVGGGFHRYSTDARWLVPHFEKMLYDNALLAVAYLEAYQVTGEPDYARVVREILLYVEREMTAPGGGFYSASDADSEGEEGTFFVWTPAQIEAVLPAAEARLVEKYYGISATGNFEGKNILHTQGSLDSTAAALKMDPGEAEKLLTSARARLYEARSKRIPPLTDHKILPSWNGLMISAFARAAQVFGDDTYAAYARAAALFITTKMKKGDRLHRSSLDGQIGGNGYLDDYAFLTAGLLDLYEATFEARWLREAMALQKVTDTHFIDAKDGGYFLTADDAEELLAREKPSYDGAEPSGNSVALLNLLRLYELTTDAAYLQRAEQLLRAFEPSWQQYPTSVPRLLSGIDFWSDRAKEIIIVVPESHAQAEPFLAQLRATYLPNRVVVVVSEGEEQEKLASLVPLVKNKSARGGKPTAYVCERQVCELPTSDPQVFAKQIARLEPLTVTGR